MGTNCVLQTTVDEQTKARAQEFFLRRELTVSEGLKVALDHEMGAGMAATSRLKACFSDAAKKIQAANISEPTAKSIVEFCNSVKTQRAQQAAEHL